MCKIPRRRDIMLDRCDDQLHHETYVSDKDFASRSSPPIFINGYGHVELLGESAHRCLWEYMPL